MHLAITSSQFGMRLEFLSNRYDCALSSSGMQRLIRLSSHVRSAPAPAPLVQWICVFDPKFKHVSTHTFITMMLRRWNWHHVILAKMIRKNATWLKDIRVADILLQVCHNNRRHFHFKPFQTITKEKLTLLSLWATAKSAPTYFSQLQWEKSP